MGAGNAWTLMFLILPVCAVFYPWRRYRIHPAARLGIAPRLVFEACCVMFDGTFRADRWSRPRHQPFISRSPFCFRQVARRSRRLGSLMVISGGGFTTHLATTTGCIPD
jgi:hypothetical protein